MLPGRVPSPCPPDGEPLCVPEPVLSQAVAIDLEVPFCIQVSNETVQGLQTLLALLMPWASTPAHPVEPAAEGAGATKAIPAAPLTPGEAGEALAAVLRLIKAQFTRLQLSNVSVGPLSMCRRVLVYAGVLVCGCPWLTTIVVCLHRVARGRWILWTRGCLVWTAPPPQALQRCTAACGTS